MTRIFYPTPDQVSLAVRWANDGPSVLDPDNGTRRGELKNRARTNNLIRVRDLIFRLHLPFRYETMRTEILHRPASSVDSRLCAQIAATLRVYGYIYRVPSGRWSVTPLTGHQLHLVRGISSGSTTTDLAQFFGQDIGRINTVLRRARANHDLASNAHLVAHAYASGWMPSYAEHGELMRAKISPEGKPYRMVAGWEKAA